MGSFAAHSKHGLRNTSVLFIACRRYSSSLYASDGGRAAQLLSQTSLLPSRLRYVTRRLSPRHCSLGIYIVCVHAQYVERYIQSLLALWHSCARPLSVAYREGVCSVSISLIGARLYTTWHRGERKTRKAPDRLHCAYWRMPLNRCLYLLNPHPAAHRLSLCMNLSIFKVLVSTI